MQVGDPFTEKLLLEACLELMATDAIVAIQDMGAAGLTSSSFEMAGQGGLGIELDLDKVPLRETGMTPYEIMLSESQERMLIVLKPGREERGAQIFEKWELDSRSSASVTDTGRMVLTLARRRRRRHPDPAAGRPRRRSTTGPWTLTDRCRPCSTPRKVPAPDGLARRAADADELPRPRQQGAGSGTSTTTWSWATPRSARGGDAAVVRVHGGHKGLAMTRTARRATCRPDPETGGRQAVAEAWRNLTASAPTPLAVTDNLNFGNPEKPEIMGQFAGAIMGMAEACTGARLPGRVGQRLALQRDRGQADPADADDRRGRA